MSTTTFKVPILNMDGQPDSSGDTIDPKGVSFPLEKVPVNYAFDSSKVLGYAHLSHEGNQIIATIQPLTPEVGEQMRGLYPAIGGYCLKIVGRTIAQCEIREVGVSTSRNQDRRIGPIP